MASYESKIAMARTEPPTARGSSVHRGTKLVVDWELRKGRLEPWRCEIVRGDRQTLTATAIRALPIGEMMAAQLAEIDYLGPRILSWYQRHGEPEPGDAERVGRVLSRGPRRGQALTQDDLAAVAKAYRDARLVGAPVTAAVAEQCHLSRSGAAKRIMAARKAGLLDDVGPNR